MKTRQCVRYPENTTKLEQLDLNCETFYRIIQRWTGHWRRALRRAEYYTQRRSNISSFYGSSCANNGKGALNTPGLDAICPRREPYRARRRIRRRALANTGSKRKRRTNVWAIPRGLDPGSLEKLSGESDPIAEYSVWCEGGERIGLCSPGSERRCSWQGW
eukprot:9494365-Pyramimonas_sp.AAC.2